MTLDIDGDYASITLEEYKKAMEFETEHPMEDRFSINIVITGTYGIQSTSMLHKYYAKDIVAKGNPNFVAINWIGKDIDRRRFLTPFIKYHGITPSQWEQFDEYVDLPPT